MADQETTENQDEEETAAEEEEESQESSEGSGSTEETGDDIETLKKEITKLRKENAKRRTDSRDSKKAKDDLEGKMKAIAKALGIDDGEEADVDGLKDKLAKVSAKMKSLKIEQALTRAARKHGADAEALTDSRSFMKDAEGLDPDGDDFTSSLDEMVEGAVKNNPKLKVGQGATRSGGEFNNPSDDGKKVSLDAALAKGDAGAINKAMDAELAAGRK